ncbi:DinB family protein [Schinkia azotoformans]|uniref:DinB family protein n=1 Tax=Schinkia azotoformans TaxID=1454 RepID=UPI002DBAEC41|nr:DinB family protein [Schinkia azotoformans]MEC1722963.1 DinB family protein [Schinkia azotoformans]MED4414869.1 DinB family protein [Schinkia azotoformans]
MQGKFDYLSELLKSVRKQLLDEVDALSDKQLNQKLSEDKWSVSQVIRHLIFIDEIVLPALKKAVQQEKSMRVVDKNIAFILDRKNKLRSPFPDPSTVFMSKDELLKKLNHVRTPLIEYLGQLTEETVFEDKSMVHPLFGPMNIKQILEFMALHEKRHIEQIKELKESI